MNLSRIVEIALKLAPLVRGLLSQRQARPPKEAGQLRREAREALLNERREMSIMPEVSSAAAPDPSPRGSLDVSDLMKVLRDAAIVGAAVAVAQVAEHLPGVDLGPYSDVIVPILVVVLGAVRRWLGGPPKK